MGETEAKLRLALKNVENAIDQLRRDQPRLSVSLLIRFEEIKAIAFKARMDIPDKKETINVKQECGNDDGGSKL